MWPPQEYVIIQQKVAGRIRKCRRRICLWETIGDDNAAADGEAEGITSFVTEKKSPFGHSFKAWSLLRRGGDRTVSQA